MQTMNKTKVVETDNKISVDIKGLQSMCGVGRNTAAKIGEEAGAVIRIGRRKLYNVQLVQEYMNSLARG